MHSSCFFVIRGEALENGVRDRACKLRGQGIGRGQNG